MVRNFDIPDSDLRIKKFSHVVKILTLVLGPCKSRFSDIVIIRRVLDEHQLAGLLGDSYGDPQQGYLLQSFF
jgi:hypothetical protein